MEKIKTFLVDDEIGAQGALKAIIAQDAPELEIVGTARNVEDAYKGIVEMRPELIFLDIQLRDQTGFDLLNESFNFHFEVIFVTAYDRYAIEAFECNALSYLLKPVSFEAFDRVKDRVLKVINKPEARHEANDAFKKAFGNRIAIPQSNSIEYLDPSELIYVKADGSYSELFLTSKRKKLISRHLKYIADRIQQSGFFRPHRSYLVNVNHITRWDRTDNGSLSLSNGDTVPLSRKGRDLLMGMVDGA